jgi:glutamate carboxypeptidase
MLSSPLDLNRRYDTNMDLKETADYLATNQDQMLDLTIRLAEINSGSFNIAGLAQVAELMQKEISVLGCEQAVMPVAPMRMINAKGEAIEKPLGSVLRFWKRPQAPTQVLLVAHMDTVFSSEHEFQHTKKTAEDILTGPGVADMKGGLAVIVWALKAFEQLPQAENLGWELVLNSDEELGSPGSAEIIESRGKKHQVGLVFEPAMDEQGTLAGERKGSGKFTLVLHGKAAHAGRNITEGRNAICKMAEVITQINNLNGQREGVTINVGFVQGGEAVNVVPDLCICRIDVRMPNIHDADWVQKNLEKIVNDIHTDSGYKLELHGKFGRKPKVLNTEMQKLYDLVKTVGASIGQEINWRSSGGCCDGNNLAAIGLPNVDTLGVRGGNPHSPDEYMIISSLSERALLLTNLLAHLSEHGFR